MSSNLSRRRFLAQSAGLAGALGLHARHSAAEPGAVREVRAGFIGLGVRGRHLLGCTLRLPGDPGLPRVRVTALADPNRRSLQRALEISKQCAPDCPSPRAFGDHRRLLDDGDVDAVFVATPVYLHAPQAIDALEAGKHVYCEKPLAPEPDACRLVLAAARSAGHGRIVQLGFQRRYSPCYEESVRFLRGGGAGRVLCIRAQWHTCAGGPKRKRWLLERKKSGDVVLEQACHQFDVFNWVLDSVPVRACGLGASGAEHGTLEQYGAVLEYPGGAKVYLTQLDFAVPDRRFSGIHELAFTESAGVDLANGILCKRDGSTRRLAQRGGNDTSNAVEAFFRSLADGTPPRAGIEGGYRATMAAILCRRALELERPVRFDEIEPG